MADGFASLVYTPLMAGDHVVKAVFSDSDIFLDDDVDNCIKVNEAGIKTYIMDNIDNYLDDLKIERIYNFDEFYNVSVDGYIGLG